MMNKKTKRIVAIIALSLSALMILGMVAGIFIR